MATSLSTLPYLDELDDRLRQYLFRRLQHLERTATAGRLGGLTGLALGGLFLWLNLPNTLLVSCLLIVIGPLIYGISAHRLYQAQLRLLKVSKAITCGWEKTVFADGAVGIKPIETHLVFNVPSTQVVFSSVDWVFIEETLQGVLELSYGAEQERLRAFLSDPGVKVEWSGLPKTKN